MDVGKAPADLSRARIEVTASNEEALAALLARLHPHGAHPVTQPDAELVAATMDGVLPAGFYSTTNLPTAVKVAGKWLEVENPEMDCGLVVSADRTGGPHRPDAPDPDGRPGRVRLGRRAGAAPGAAERAQPVRVHGLRGVLGEAEGSPGGRGRRADPAGPGRGREAPGRVRPGRDPHRRRARRGHPGAGGVRRRPLRRQRFRHPRHRVEPARHVARRVGQGGHRRRGRARQPSAGHQRGAPLGLHPGRRGTGTPQGRRDVRVRPGGRAVRAGRLDPRRRARSPTC